MIHEFTINELIPTETVGIEADAFDAITMTERNADIQESKVPILKIHMATGHFPYSERHLIYNVSHKDFPAWTYPVHKSKFKFDMKRG